MATGIIKMAVKSVIFYRRQVIYQVLIVALLSSVITGSLLTGWSVRASLKESSVKKLGNTGILISSGPRYIDPSLAERLKSSSGLPSTSLLETEGFCQNLSTQKGAFKTHIWAVDSTFFTFHGIENIHLREGELAINEKIAASLGLKEGDDVILKFRNISDIPADAPFAPAKGDDISVVLKVGNIIGKESMGDFSLSINQTVPGNIFIALDQLNSLLSGKPGINRILIGRNNGYSAGMIYSILKKELKLSDIGLRTLYDRKAGMTELRSDRIFIDKAVIDEVRAAIPGAYPLITYLGNRFEAGSRSTPYSFVSALPEELYPEVPAGNGMIINRWLADDLEAEPGDTVKMSWYSPDSLNKLVERSGSFIVTRIKDIDGKWADSLLMPSFPGIAGSESCSDWDAGVQINFKKIRHKDEDYWKKYGGTPKAFIGYNEGVAIWGSNYGPATAIRFPAQISGSDISAALNGKLEPSDNGLVIKDIYKESVRAANESVDFSSLFLSLGIFLIIASIVLLGFSFNNYLRAKDGQIRTYFALGFRQKWIMQLIFSESGFVTLAGAIFGSISGIILTFLLIKLLNTVWQGAVQTNALSAYISPIPVLYGFAATTIITWLFLLIRLRLHMNQLSRERKIIRSAPSSRLNLLVMLLLSTVSVALFISSFIFTGSSIILSFLAGSILLVSMIFILRQYFFRKTPLQAGSGFLLNSLSRRYYSFNISQAIAPVLFIAAGIFAVFITEANRIPGSASAHLRSGGTGGFLAWCDASIPVRPDLSVRQGRSDLGLDDKEADGMKIVSMKRYAGDDASCLNLNHVAMPPLIGVDPAEFISRGSFSFASSVKSAGITNPWQFLSLTPGNSTIYGIADQTVLDWGLMIKPGDTLVMRGENGQRLNIIMAAGLKSSVFQGYVLIGMDNFRKFFPSISGSSVLLLDGEPSKTDQYISILTDRLEGYGIDIEKTNNRLASFREVTNTYLSVFGVFGALGMVTGIAGLGFILLKNYNSRKKEFALMLASGFRLNRIRNIIFTEQLFILLAGILTGLLPAIISTFPSLRSNNEFPWIGLAIMVMAILLTGIATLQLTLRNVTDSSLIASLKKE